MSGISEQPPPPCKKIETNCTHTELGTSDRSCPVASSSGRSMSTMSNHLLPQEPRQQVIQRIKQKCDGLLAQQPRDWSAVYDCSVELLGIDEPAEALFIVDYILEENPGWLRKEYALLQQSKCQFKLGYTLRSRRTLEECLKANPSLEEALEWEKERESIVIKEGQKFLFWALGLAAAGFLYLGYRKTKARSAAGGQ